LTEFRGAEELSHRKAELGGKRTLQEIAKRRENGSRSLGKTRDKKKGGIVTHRPKQNSKTKKRRTDKSAPHSSALLGKKGYTGRGVKVFLPRFKPIKQEKS